jgi:hypothetical protein
MPKKDGKKKAKQQRMEQVRPPASSESCSPAKRNKSRFAFFL